MYLDNELYFTAIYKKPGEISPGQNCIGGFNMAFNSEQPINYLTTATGFFLFRLPHHMRTPVIGKLEQIIPTIKVIVFPI